MDSGRKNILIVSIIQIIWAVIGNAIAIMMMPTTVPAAFDAAMGAMQGIMGVMMLVGGVSLVLSVIIAVLVAKDAGAKGKSAILYGILGLIFGWLMGIIYSLAISKDK
jgi:hypothetical protein